MAPPERRVISCKSDGIAILETISSPAKGPTVIDFLPTEEQRQIIESVSSYLASRFPVSRLKTQSVDVATQDASAWLGLEELGVFSMALPPTHGGAGYGQAEEVLVFRELGRFLLSPRALATALAVKAAFVTGETVILDAIVRGRATAAIGVPIGAATAGPAGDGSFYAIDGRDADFLVVWNGQGLGLYGRETLRPATLCIPLDQSVQQQEILLAGARPAVWAGPETGLSWHAETLVCAMLSGIAEAARDSAVAYATFRQQFGKPIGGFQAVKHKCADMALRAEAGWSQTVLAMLTLREHGPGTDAQFQILAAKILSIDGALKNAAGNIQIHGGIGFTAEHVAHRFLKRAHIYEHFGNSARASAKLLLTMPNSMTDNCRSAAA
jgi:alkylation response protein AidB-like acyl-CoA dehydrogenase